MINYFICAKQRVGVFFVMDEKSPPSSEAYKQNYTNLAKTFSKIKNTRRKKPPRRKKKKVFKCLNTPWGIW